VSGMQASQGKSGIPEFGGIGLPRLFRNASKSLVKLEWRCGFCTGTRDLKVALVSVGILRTDGKEWRTEGGC
jgi:hypothetical protein